MLLRVTKVKDISTENSSKVGISYEQVIGDGSDTDECSFKSSDVPHDSFYTALRDLVPYVCYMCEASDTWDEETIRVTGVTFSYNEAGKFGVVVTAMKTLQVSKTPLTINTPHHVFDPDSDFYSEVEEKLFVQVQKESLRYIRGDRKFKQLNLLPEANDLTYDDAIAQARELGRQFGFEVRELVEVR